VKKAVLLASLALAGCPSTWAFQGRICAAKAAQVRIVAASPSGVVAEDLEPVKGARVECDGCSVREPPVDENGQFRVGLGSSYDPPPPVKLRVSAPGYETVELEVTKSPRISQAGPPVMFVVLKPLAVAAQ
jgi:hypothetical protein